MRWGQLDYGAVLDVATSDRGELAWLRATDCLVERRVRTYSPLLSWLHATGGLVPEHLYAPRRLADYVTADPLVVEGTQARVAVTGAPGIFGNLAFDFNAIGGQALRATDVAIGNLATSLVAVGMVRLDAGGNGGIFGRQNGTSEGWNVLLVAGVPTLQVGDVGGVQVNVPLTALSGALGDWRALVVYLDVVNRVAHFASDIEAGVSVAFPPGVVTGDVVPLRIGDSRLPPSVFNAYDGQHGVLGLYRPTAAVAPLALAQQVKAAWDSAAGIPGARGSLDGDAGVELSWMTPWIRPNNTASHLGFRVIDAHFAGEYEGDHALSCELYADYDETASVATFRVPELRVALNRYNGLQYLYRVPVGGLNSYRAVRLRFRDEGGEVSSFRAARLDVAIEVASPDQIERDAELDMASV
jgi:hypothetical protein